MGSDHEPKHNMKRMEDHCRMPVYIMDVMLSLLAHADISDIAAEVTLFGQTLYDFLETLHCVDVAADYEDKHTTSLSGRRTWVAIKLASTYARISLKLPAILTH